MRQRVRAMTNDRGPKEKEREREREDSTQIVPDKAKGEYSHHRCRTRSSRFETKGETHRGRRGEKSESSLHIRISGTAPPNDEHHPGRSLRISALKM